MSDESEDEFECTELDTRYDNEATSAAASKSSSRSAANKKKSASTVDEDESETYKVTFNVTITQAIPTAKTETEPSEISTVPPSRGSQYPASTVEEDEGRSSKKKEGLPKAQSFYHYEYTLVPQESDQSFKMDIVSFGTAVRIFTERQEPKTVKTWQDGEQTWVTWTQCHTVVLTDEALKKMFTHNLEVRIWDSKDKVSTRAKMDRPKSLRVHPSRDENFVKGLIMKHCEDYEQMQPKNTRVSRPLPSQPKIDYDLDPIQLQMQKDAAKVAKEKKQKGSKDSKLDQFPPKASKEQRLASGKSKKSKGSAKKKPKSPLSSDEKKAPMEGHRSSTPRPKAKPDGRPPSSISTVRAAADQSQQQPQQAVQPAVPQQPAQPQQGEDDVVTAKKKELKKKDSKALEEQMKKFGRCFVPIRMANFFAGLESVTERLEVPVEPVPDAFVTVSVNKPIMSEEQKRKLNPLVIKVHSATNMPNTPLSYADLRLKCVPAFIRYRMLGGEHVSVGRLQDKNIYWDDINVMLLGLMDHCEVQECLGGPHMEIELHDRDRIPERQKLKPTLFGHDAEDEKINNVGSITSKRTVNNAFDLRSQPWDPYGVAKFDLSGLLLGERVMQIKVPIQQCPLPDVLGMREHKHEKVIGLPGAIDGPLDKPLQAGHYLDNEAMMKIKVEVAFPLVTPQQLAAKQPMTSAEQCPFARMVLKFGYKNVKFLHSLQSLITETNAKALKLDDMPGHIIEAALSTYKLSLEQQKDTSLNILTGFQVLDGDMHLFVLEGLKDNAISQIWQTLPKPEQSDIEILYNSDLCFQERLYGALDVDVCRIKLHEPLSVITQQPLLYVRDMVPKPCFDALVKLEQLCKMEKLRKVWRNSLFPSAEMVVSMSREFGVPITAEDFEDLQPQLPKIQEEAPVQLYAPPSTTRVWTPIDNYNSSYVDKLNDRHTSGISIDHQKENMNLVRQKSVLNKLNRSKTSVTTVKVTDQPVHNYSSQALNSTEQAKEQVRQLLHQNDPERRYTYCQDYQHSGTVVPDNVEALKKAELLESMSRWKTSLGWTYPGMKTSTQSNQHSKKPDEARAQELQAPWVANIMHGKDRSVLERAPYKWSKRNKDMNTWSKPVLDFGQERPVTIHLSGIHQEAERQAVQMEHAQQWRSKVVVDDVRSHFHRCATDTELLDKGPKSSNQVDRLKGLLKDQPQKYALQKHAIGMYESGPLSVVLNPSVDIAARRAGLPIIPAIDNEFDQKVKGLNPGPYEDISLSNQKNTIPIRDYQREKYRQLKGQDFNVFHKDRTVLHKRRALPLVDEEYGTHLFYFQPDPCTFQDSYGNTYTIPNVEDFQQHMCVDQEARNVSFETHARPSEMTPQRTETVA